MFQKWSFEGARLKTGCGNMIFASTKICIRARIYSCRADFSPRKNGLKTSHFLSAEGWRAAPVLERSALKGMILTLSTPFKAVPLELFKNAGFSPGGSTSITVRVFLKHALPSVSPTQPGTLVVGGPQGEKGGKAKRI